MIRSIKDVIQNIPVYTDKVYAEQPSEQLLDAADRFFSQLPAQHRRLLELGGLSRRDGLLVMDWAVRRDFVSVEVSETAVGFYSELPDGSNPEGVFPALQEGDPCPAPIVQALDLLYSTKKEKDGNKKRKL